MEIQCFKLTAEDLLNHSETIARLDNYGDGYLIGQKIKKDLSKTKNYIDYTYYHATGGFGEIGLGKGLYLGKDKKALNNFYNSDGESGNIEVYYGTLIFIDLIDYAEFEKFEKEAEKMYPNANHNEHFKFLTIQEGFDGIRYYDPLATGEEFVLFNTDKVTMISKPKKSKEFIL